MAATVPPGDRPAGTVPAMQSAPWGAPASAPVGGPAEPPYQPGVPITFDPWAGPPPPGLPPVHPRSHPRSRRRRDLIIACVAGVVLLAMAGGAAVVAGTSARRSAAEEASLARAKARIEKELPRLLAWVSSDRGLQWKSTVRPEVLSDRDFVAALRGGGDGGLPATSAQDPDDLGSTLTAMGLVPSADAYYGADDAALASGVVGFYDDQTRRLVVRGIAWTPPMEYTLVHELTHALQDQAFDLGGMKSATRYDDESADTIRAVIEGDAVRVADDYYDQQDPAWQRSVDSDQGSGAASRQPIVDTLGALPYVVGSRFVGTLAHSGGNPAVDRAFTHPPTTSQQLLRPADWLAGRLPAPAPVPMPSPGSGQVADRGVLGQLGLWLTVDGEHPKLSDAKALDGWDGDAYVSTSSQGSGACLVDQVHFTDAAARTKALAFLQPWITAQHVYAQTDSVSDVRLSTCSG